MRVVEPDQLGNLLQHFTGSKLHNTALRDAAVRKGLHVSEYGITDDATGETHRCASEAEVYELLGLPYIPPELREDRGELRFRSQDDVPQLVTQDDLRGDLHMHTIASDGRGTITDMALAARERGLAYIAITDHSASHGFGNDVTPDELRRQIERVRAADEQVEGIRSSPAARRTSCRTDPSTTTTTCSRSSTGSSRPSTPPSGSASGR